ncbi:type II toxin-antitoxin system HigB family toxin [Persicitalea jodogahamensis]|uniref:Type II toxin-antitoxin system HigB family toxin n=1 Tax=Persicitalea jodogahamensis TaxID=402147 RepID=A0A8J3D341_9BACT|nr:type II toxin-antitoxin system HigB family toxin [Persicitalea jodogahamensis]GHB62813.1 hypothetical protein GCM10007390_15810 [Persicitalea jodogahamensis]
MVVISKTILVEFCQQHSSASSALNDWYKRVKLADWNDLNAVKQTFNSTDYVGNDRFVFNVRGNRYRIVAMIFFDKRTVFIRFVGTHAEYNKIDCTTI